MKAFLTPVTPLIRHWGRSSALGSPGDDYTVWEFRLTTQGVSRNTQPQSFCIPDIVDSVSGHFVLTLSDFR